MMPLKTLLSSIADAIRFVDGSTSEILPSNFPQRIRALGDSGTVWAVLYEDGFMSVQYGSAARHADAHGSVAASFEDPLPSASIVPQAEDWGWHESRKAVREVLFDDRIFIETAAFMCSGCHNLAKFDLGLAYLMDCVSLESMFANCGNLADVDVSGWDVGNVATLEKMFYWCNALPSIDLTTWDVSGVTTAASMFEDCASLSSADVSGIAFESLTTASSVFAGCYQLADVRLGGATFPLLESVVAAFFGCSGLASLDLGGISLPKLSFANQTFQGCGLTGCDLSGIGAKVTQCYMLFRGCASLEQVDVRGLVCPGTTRCNEVFRECASLTSLDLSSWDTSSLKDVEDAFLDCSSLTTIEVGDGWDVSALVPASAAADPVYVFKGCAALVGGNGTGNADDSHAEIRYAVVDADSAPGLLTFKLTPATGQVAYALRYADGFVSLQLDDVATDSDSHGAVADCSSFTLPSATATRSAWPWGSYSSEVTSFALRDEVALESCLAMFADCASMERADMSKASLGYCASISLMFSGCTSLEEVAGIEDWDLSACEDASYAFSRCSSLATLSLSGWGMKALESANSMFSGCGGLTAIDINGWRCPLLSKCGYMFSGCSSLTSLDVSRIRANPSSVSDFAAGCSSLVSADVANLVGLGVTSLSAFFYGCSALAELDLSTWDTTNVTSLHQAFYGCSSLRRVYVGEGWSNAGAKSKTDMCFYGCSLLAECMGADLESDGTGSEHATASTVKAVPYMTLKTT